MATAALDYCHKWKCCQGKQYFFACCLFHPARSRCLCFCALSRWDPHRFLVASLSRASVEERERLIVFSFNCIYNYKNRNKVWRRLAPFVSLTGSARCRIFASGPCSPFWGQTFCAAPIAPSSRRPSCWGLVPADGCCSQSATNKSKRFHQTQMLKTMPGHILLFSDFRKIVFSLLK